jgi:hypothetical protein
MGFSFLTICGLSNTGITRRETQAMIIRRSNGNTTATTGEECFMAAERHHTRSQMVSPRPWPNDASGLPETVANGSAGTGAAYAGDIIYGAKAIAFFIFGDDGNRSRRRVFNLWAHYSARKERAGFFKLKGALCLSKAQWRAFHGLG